MKKLLLFIALLASVGLYAQVQPTIVNGNMEYTLYNGSETTVKRYSGWINKDLGKEPGESSTMTNSLKIEAGDGDYGYQEVEVLENTDYELTYRLKIATNGTIPASFQALILKGSNYVVGYTPDYGDAVDRPTRDMGYESYLDCNDAANIIADKVTADPGNTSDFYVTLPFNSGSETSIAIVFRGLGTLDINGADSACGDATINYTEVSLTNVTPAQAGVQLTDLLVDGITVTGFDKTILPYEVELAKGTTVVPTVTYVADAAAASAVLTDATELPGTTTVLVTAADASTQTYSITFNAEPFDDDATLSDLLVDAVTIDDFDSEVYDYTVELGVGVRTTPTVTATANSAFAVAPVIAPAPSVPGTTTVLVEAEDGSTATYSIKFTNIDPSAPEQPVVQNYDFVKLPKASGSDASCSGWQNGDLGTDGETNTISSSNGYYAIKFDNAEQDIMYQEVAVQAGKDYELIFDRRIDPGTSVLDIRILKGSGYDGGSGLYTPAYLDNEVAPSSGYGYTSIADVENAANNLVSELISSPGHDNFALDTLTFNSGTETSIAIFARGVVALTGDDTWVNGDTEVKIDSVNLINTTIPVLEDGITLTDLQVDAVTVDGFDSQDLFYDVVLDRGVTTVPSVTFTAHASALSAVGTPAAAIPGTSRVLVTAADGTTKAEYAISFTNLTDGISTLDDLLIDLVTVDGFASDELSYDVELDNGTTVVPTVTADETSDYATAVVTPAASLPGTTTILVTADDGSQQTYEINFTVALNDDATLSALNVDAVLVDGFDADQLTYDVELDNGTTVVPTVTATETELTSDAVVTPAASLPGTTSVLVTAEDGTEQTYEINFTVALNDDATLSALNVDAVLVDGFDADQLSYDVVLDNGTTVVPTVTATETELTSDAVVTPAASLPGTTSVLVTAEDGTEQTYEINFTVALNSDTTLSALNVDATILPDFASTKQSYTYGLAVGTTVVPTVTATETVGTSNAVVTPAASLPGTTSVLVTAEDGSTATYTIQFYIGEDPDASLSALNVDAVLVDGFAATTLSYDVELDNGTTVVPTVTATASSATAETPVVTPAASLPGTTTVLVTAEDGTEQTYEISFTVALNDDATLSDLQVDAVTVAGFDADDLSYDVELDFGTTTVPTVTATETESTTTAVVTPAASLPGTTTVLVTAEDGTAQTYSVVFTIAAGNNDATLSDLQVDAATVTGFAAGTLSYDVELAAGTTTVPTVTATETESTSTAVVTPASSLPGTTEVVVTAQDGTAQTYEISFTVAVPSAISDVASLEFSAYTNNNILFVNSTDELLNGTVYLYTLSGKVVASHTINSNIEQFDMTSTGLFIVVVTNSNNELVGTLKVLNK